ncbi:hypothetical protein [Aeromonas veronii]|uniref:hypothetical protein n=1 Tax=Aeromonas veronii TaxID=654 RepID=UPI003D22757B
MRGYALNVLSLLMLSFLLMLMMSSTARAALLERVLPVSVNIVTHQASSDLEIVADKSAFLVVYSSASQHFLPLDIPFKVRSLSGLSMAYNLSMSQLGGLCDGVTPLVPSPTLDGAPIVLNQQYRFTGTENAHVLTLSFPFLAQASLAQQCEGYARVVAELTV